MTQKLQKFRLLIITGNDYIKISEEAHGFYSDEGSFKFFKFSDDGNYYQEVISAYPINRTVIYEIK